MILSLFCLVFTIFGVILQSYSTDATQSLCHDNAGFSLLLDDQFDYPAINKTIWNIVEDDGRYLYHFACGRSALCTRSNAYVEDGDLVLRTRREHKVSPKFPDKTYDFTSAGVHTRDKFVIHSTPNTVTRVCVRGKLPMGELIPNEDGTIIDTGKGLFPAYWIMANNARNMKNAADDSDGYDDKHPGRYLSCNPDEGETDIMEHLNSENKLYSTYHYQDTKETCQFPKDLKSWSLDYTKDDLSEAYHEYAIEKGPDYISFFIDGQWLNTVSESNSTIRINATSSSFIWLNTAMGGWPGEPTDETKGPFYNRIDYVKVSQREVSNSLMSNTLLIVIISVACALVVILLFMLAVGKLCCGTKRRVREEDRLLN